jgi:hypothetical protein
MEFLLLYLVFALATSITALLEFFWPIVQSIRTTKPTTMVAENWKTALFSLTVAGMLIAPMLLFVTIVPKYNESFRYHLEESLTRQE